MRQLYILTTLLLASCILHSQTITPDQRYRLLTGNNYVQSKNYYLLTLLKEDKAVSRLLETDDTLRTLAKTRREAVTLAMKGCAADAACYTEKLKFSEEEIATIGRRLTALCKKENALGQLVQKHLLPSCTYILYKDLEPQQQLVKAWEQDANGINFAIGVYGEGKKPSYPLIDSISPELSGKRLSAVLYTATYTLLGENTDSTIFFSLPLNAALMLVELNDRNRAADYEPMADGVNKAAVDRVKTIDWSKYKYTLILVPGAGPEDPTVPLSAEGMIRCRLAVIQYKKGMAPYIMVSGGKVHPYKTKYCEAIEMKTFLVNEMHIPENAVIVEPHARHTTTNMRNCARLVFRYGMPFSKPCLAVTSRGQSTMISATLAARCQKELQEVPFKNGLRLSETEAEFYPLADALQINPKELM
ncbi:MAG: YdcF family protein, partial [Bacteroidetes bacterium]|nr:YdcF family protein [Bacteroidota bacterium]